jgi:hypothetical protein
MKDHLYRFYSLPTEESVKTIFDRDGIQFESKTTTIDNVLNQARAIYKSKFEDFFVNILEKDITPQQLGEPYFRLNAESSG